MKTNEIYKKNNKMFNKQYCFDTLLKLKKNK